MLVTPTAQGPSPALAGDAPLRDPAAALAAVRDRTLALVDGLDDDVLERVHAPILSPLVWDLAHIAAYEDLWLVHRHGGRPLLRPDLAHTYDAFETPRQARGSIRLLDRAESAAYLEAVRERALEVLEERGAGDGTRLDLVLRHEQQHTETMLQTLCLARPDGWRPAFARPLPPAPPGDPPSGLEAVDVPAGPFAMGAGPVGFAYDNERPRHVVQVEAFRIGRTPVTAAAFAEWVDAGGYERREWWSQQGWAWRCAEGAERPAGWTADGREWRAGEGLVAIDPARPVVHVCFWEAEAFARAHGARLPTEAEWEKAASGAPPADPAGANVDQGGLAPAPAGAYPGSASAYGALGMLGDVWEWTATAFHGYPGFRAHPYREYSEVFFDRGYRVLRGGSWATQARVATATFRNWDLPQRRQIFAGFRLAWDA